MDQKQCLCCKQVKLTSEFSKNVRRNDGFSAYCKPCNALKDKRYYEKNKDARIAYIKSWGVDNVEKTRAYKRKYKLVNPDIDKLYKRNNKSLVNFTNAKRRANTKNRTPAWLTEFDLLKIKCLYQVAAMRNRESGYDWHVDHIIPLQGVFVSGLHVPDNLRVIPAVDNMRKNNHYEV
jgi:hypothetical protein